MTTDGLTILIGPYTRLSLALNSSVRAVRGVPGLVAMPTRTASPLMRALALGEEPVETRLATFQAALGDVRPAILSALSFLGAPSAAIAKRELFPDMAALCLGLSKAFDAPPRLVLAVEPLDQFFCSIGSDPLARRVSSTPWEVLYEVSWADLAGDIVAAIPGVELAVIRPETALCRPVQLAETLFGEAAGRVDPEAWRAAHLSPAGQAALAQMDVARQSESTLIALGQELGTGLDDATLEARFGIDPLTRTLLAQRFEEDLAAISDLPGVRML